MRNHSAVIRQIRNGRFSEAIVLGMGESVNNTSKICAINLFRY